MSDKGIILSILISIAMLIAGFFIGINVNVPGFTLTFNPEPEQSSIPASPTITAPAPQSQPTITITAPSQPEVTESVTETEPDLILLKTWQGTGLKTTEPLIITKSPWYITWSSNPEIIDGESIGILQIMVYSTESPNFPLTLAANTQAKEVDTSAVYNTGSFFLKINGANTDWEVTVFESRR